MDAATSECLGDWACRNESQLPHVSSVTLGHSFVKGKPLKWVHTFISLSLHWEWSVQFLKSSQGIIPIFLVQSIGCFIMALISWTTSLCAPKFIHGYFLTKMNFLNCTYLWATFFKCFWSAFAYDSQNKSV
jgi:hypothetical protein